MDKKVKIVIGSEVTEIDEIDLYTDNPCIAFGGAYLVQVMQVDGKFIATNAVDGWGKNCKQLFEGKKVHILEAD